MKVLSLRKGRVRLLFEAYRGFYLNELPLKRLPGLKSYSFNSRRGSLLLEYEPSTISEVDLIKVIEDLARANLFTRRVSSSSISRENTPSPTSLLFRRGIVMLLSPILPMSLRLIFFIKLTSPFLMKALWALLQRRTNLDLLNGLAIGAALIQGKYTTASMIAFLLRLGDSLEAWALRDASKASSELSYFEEGLAWVVREGAEYPVRIRDLRVGDIVRVTAGHRIPVDGVVLEGEALVNQSFLTGETQGILKSKGSYVYAMSALEEGQLLIRAEKVGEETRVFGLSRLTEQAEANKARLQKKLEILGEKLVKAVLALAVIVSVLTRDLLRGASVLLVDYSCALKLASSLAFSTAVSRARREGILLRSFRAFEALSKAEIILFDKTGTLTILEPRVVEVISLGDYDENELLRLVACVEEHFPHPVAKAVVAHSEKLGLKHEERHSEVNLVAGHGIISSYDGVKIAVGSKHFIFEDLGIREEPFRDLIKIVERKGYSVLYVAVGDKLSGLILLDVPIRDEAERVIRSLQEERGLRVVLLTGDSKSFARRVARSLGFKEWHAELLPEDKMRYVSEYQQKGFTVAMIGDGMNDAPALAQADVGIALKGGAELAQVASDIVLEGNSLLPLLFALDLSKEVTKRLERSYWIIITTNTALLLGSSLGIISPVISALTHNLTTLGISLYNLGLRRWKAHDHE